MPTGKGKLKLILRAQRFLPMQTHPGICMVSSMSDNVSAPGSKRHKRFRSFGAYASFSEAGAELRAYWHSRTPQERMEALEELRILNYGQEAIDARIPRICGVLEPRRR
jgi:hypothetical protein